MEKQGSQFGIFALFVLMTGAAVACAVFRLPVSTFAKLLVVQLVVGCFVTWAVPRGPNETRPGRRRFAAAMNFAMSAVLAGYLAWTFYSVPRRPHWLVDCSIGSLVLGMVVIAIMQARMMIRGTGRG